MLLDPLDIPADIKPLTATVLDNGALEISWSHDGLISAYHPGWLRAHAYFGRRTPSTHATTVTWDAATLAAPPTFDGRDGAAKTSRST